MFNNNIRHREGQRELNCVFVDLEKAYDRVPREEMRCIYEKIRNTGKIRATCTGYVQGKRNSGEVCSKNYRKFQGQGRTAPGFRVKFVSVCCNYE